jgi:hypothetical protein
MALDDKQKEWAQHEVFGTSGGEGEGEGGESSGEGTGEGTGSEGGGADFYEQTFQADGYSLGTDPCLDRCWAEFKKCCNNSTSGGLECLAQLNACRERCASQAAGEGTDEGADFYVQTLQADGYTLGTDPCLDRCWAEFKKCCNNSTSGGLECLAQLNACRERCASQAAGEGTDEGADFYVQTLQEDGYTLGTDPCLDRCWAEFEKCCKNSTSGGLECLAQLNACRERCGSVASSQPAGEGTGEETGEGKGTDEATGGAAGEGTDGGTGEGSAGAAQIVFQAGVREQTTGHPHAGQNLQLRWESLNVGTARSGAFTSKLEVWPTTTDLGGVCIEPSGDPAYSADVDEDDLGPGESHEKNETAPTTTAGWYYIRVTLNGGVSTTNCVEVLERE